MSRHPDLLIVGAGVIGAACAMHAAERGMRVLVLERGRPAGGATAAGMGHIVVMDDSPAQMALTSLSRSLVNALGADLPGAVEHDRCGTLWIAADRADLAQAHARCALYRSQGVAAELLDGRQLAAAEPALRSGLSGALLVPDDGVLYQPALVRWMLHRAGVAGAELRTGADVQSVGPTGATTSAGFVAAGAVLVAAGIGSVQLLPRLPVLPRKGHLAVTAPGQTMVRHQLVELGYLQSAHALSASSVAFNVQPRRRGQLLIGSSRELAGHDASVNRQVLGSMLARAAAFMPALAQQPILRVWTGFRPATPDKLPLIGHSHDHDGVWVATGHEGLGITTALGTAAVVTALLLGEAPPIDATAFDPDGRVAFAGQQA